MKLLITILVNIFKYLQTDRNFHKMELLFSLLQHRTKSNNSIQRY